MRYVIKSLFPKGYIGKQIGENWALCVKEPRDAITFDSEEAAKKYIKEEKLSKKLTQIEKVEE